jgi:hypothetical protein
MRKFTIAAATIAFGALLASAPAKALEDWGPKQVGNQCVKIHPYFARDQRFGVWSACPQTASVSVAPTAQRSRARHRATAR